MTLDELWEKYGDKTVWKVTLWTIKGVNYGSVSECDVEGVKPGHILLACGGLGDWDIIEYPIEDVYLSLEEAESKLPPPPPRSILVKPRWNLS